jgi:alkylhydroperoxidase family enzyme
VLPRALRGVAPLRRLSLRATTLVLRRMDLAVRPYGTTFADACTRLEAAGGAAAALEPLRTRPQLVEWLALGVEERSHPGALDRATRARVQRAVAAALPRGAEEADGPHARSPEPVEAFAVLGTRYAHRATAADVAALRRVGHDDRAILELAIEIADANQWARLHRLAGIPADAYPPGTA